VTLQASRGPSACRCCFGCKLAENGFEDIELYVKIGLNAFETCDGMRTVAKIAAYFMTSMSAVYRQTDGL